MKAIAVDNDREIVEFETVARAREWTAWMNAHGGTFRVIKASDSDYSFYV